MKVYNGCVFLVVESDTKRIVASTPSRRGRTPWLRRRKVRRPNHINIVPSTKLVVPLPVMVVEAFSVYGVLGLGCLLR